MNQPHTYHAHILTHTHTHTHTGNGRPFCLEILRAARSATVEQLESVRQSVNSMEDKNHMGDISLAQLIPVRIDDDFVNAFEGSIYTLCTIHYTPYFKPTSHSTHHTLNTSYTMHNVFAD
ncbi:hypothetical protein EON63_09615 [archaeon]|nr:MAG: hypothetical protein EON63_09615 [archaeon]